MDYRELLLLRAARETGVLDALVSSADTASEVAEAAGVTERAAETTVGALCDMGFLERVGGGVEPTNRMLGFVTKTDVRSIGSLPHRLDVADALLALPETMATGELPEPTDRERAHRNRLGAAAAEDDARIRAAVTAAVREHPDADSVLVVGDDGGQHAVEFAARGFDVALRHDAETVDALRPLLAPEPVELVPGDPREAVDADADIVYLPGVARRHSPAANRDLLAAARDAAASDGVVVHVDAFDSAPALAAELLATTDAGRVHETDAVVEWFADAGFRDTGTADVPGTPYGLVAGRRAVE
jgi:hypothetical protein